MVYNKYGDDIMRRRFGDRKDGYKLRKADPFFRIIPYLMKERSDAQVFFEDRIYLDQTNVLIRKLRKEGYKLGFLHVLIASMVRTMSQKPKINRFVRGHKTYARRDISFSLAVKKDMSEIIHNGGYEPNKELVQKLSDDYKRRCISPGGSADMLVIKIIYEDLKKLIRY